MRRVLLSGVLAAGCLLGAAVPAQASPVPFILDTVNGGTCMGYLEYLREHGTHDATMDYEVQPGGTRVCKITTASYVDTFSQVRMEPVVITRTWTE